MIIDDFKNKNGDWARWTSRKDHPLGKKYPTLSGMTWDNINSRCKSGGSVQKLHPSYIGCENKFENFQEFSNWYQNQVGYGIKEQNGRVWHCDHNLLIAGSKLYSPSTCILLPNVLNGLIKNRYLTKDDLPIGITKQGAKFRLDCINSTKNKFNNYIGMYDNVEDAFEVYKLTKEQHIRVVSTEWKDKIDIKAYNALMNFKIILDI
jgi:hypothetical protein